MVEAFLMNLFLLKKPPGWHLRLLGLPWLVLDWGCQVHPHCKVHNTGFSSNYANCSFLYNLLFAF